MEIDSLENLRNQTPHKVKNVDSWAFSMEYKCNQTHPLCFSVTEIDLTSFRWLRLQALLIQMIVLITCSVH
ncbi:hypothetical protein LguiA_001914 [Lonicera macranthoides]